MKRILNLTAILFFLVVTHATAQVGFGLKGGLNFTNLNVDDPEASYDSRTGYHAGVFLRGKFDKVAIQPEVLLFTQSNTTQYTTNTVKQNFTYLSIPVILKFYPVSGFNIQAGPQFGFLLDGERTTDDGLIKLKQDIKYYYKSSDVSVSVGLGYDFNFGLGLDFRYNIGVQDINNLSGGEKAKSQVFMFSLGWNFLSN